MPGHKRSISRSTVPEIKALRERVHELEETLAAIRGGEIDALVINGPSGDQVFTLQGAEHPYRILVESINEGAATLDGKIDHVTARTLDRAVEEAARDAAASGLDHPVVLLSPACASFDQFQSFEARGTVFRDLVQKLPGVVAPAKA